ncbi:MAG: hypothetical protein R2828_18375 [Saprospiraceae bacterium]
MTISMAPVSLGLAPNLRYRGKIPMGLGGLVVQWQSKLKSKFQCLNLPKKNLQPNLHYLHPSNNSASKKTSLLRAFSRLFYRWRIPMGLERAGLGDFNGNGNFNQNQNFNDNINGACVAGACPQPPLPPRPKNALIHDNLERPSHKLRCIR